MSSTSVLDQSRQSDRSAADLAETRAEALFASDLQRSAEVTADSVRHAVTATVRRLGTRGCAARVAEEFGEHPEVAVDRMRWALGAVRQAYALG